MKTRTKLQIRFMGGYLYLGDDDFTTAKAASFFAGDVGGAPEVSSVYDMLNDLCNEGWLTKIVDERRRGHGETVHWRPSTLRSRGLRGDFAINGNPIRFRKHTNEELGIEVTRFGQCGR
jgi:hypothetical protein